MFILTLLFSFSFSHQEHSKKRLRTYQRDKTINDNICDVCKKAIDYIDKCLKDEKIEEEIMESLNNLCVQYPAPYDKLCLQYVEKYVPLIINWIESGIERNDICSSIGLCPSKKVKNHNSQYKAQSFKNLFKGLPKDDNYPCQICTQLVDQIEAYILDPNFLGSLDYLLDQVCGLVPSEFERPCEILVDDLIRWIMEYLDEALDNLNICSKLHLCPDLITTVSQRPKIVRRPHIIKNKIGDDYCTICTITINYIDSKMKDKEVQEEIISGLDGFCDTLSFFYADACKLIAELYVPLVMELIDEGLESLDICNKLGFCTGQEIILRKAKNQKPLYVPKQFHKTKKNSSGICESCIETIRLIEQLLQDKKLEDEIISLLDQFCDTLPGDTSKTCKDIAAKYVPLVIKLIETGIETLDICTKIGFCFHANYPEKVYTPRYQYKVDANKIVDYYKQIKKSRQNKVI